jgi:RNA polymerase sigma-32 factor
LVLAVARKYRHYGIPVSELVAEGNVGVVIALAKFRPERGVRFVTYASYWVRAQMLARVVKSYSAVSGGGGPLRSQLFFKLRRERVRAANQFGSGDAADAVLAERLGLSLERLQAMTRRLDGRDVSLDARGGVDARTLVERLPAPDDQEQEYLAREVGVPVKDALRVALDTLDARERYIVERHLMADANEELSLAAIAVRFGVSRERVRQLEARAKAKLRKLLELAEHPAVREWLSSELSRAAERRAEAAPREPGRRRRPSNIAA